MDGIVIIKSKGVRYRKKIAAFDFDHTLVCPKTGNTFAKSVDDWRWWRPTVPKSIRNLYKRGFSIVIFSNQRNKFKVEQVNIAMDSIGVPYMAYIIYNKAIKKPNNASFLQYVNGREYDTDESFYVGDAGGRSNDWSAVDKDFAKNSGIAYITPEDMFPAGSAPRFVSPVVHPLHKQELVIMAGYPGSGKSTIAARSFPKYTVLSGDELKTESKIKKGLVSALASGKSVVIDATNPSRQKRKVFIDIAKNYKVAVRIVHVATSLEESSARNAQREKKVPPVALFMFRKRFEAPRKNEGVSDVITLQ